MSRQKNRFLTLCAAATTALMLAGTAQAVDLRSWDHKINDVTKRFIVLPAFKSEAVLDKETQLVWQRSPRTFKTQWIGAFTGCLHTPIGGRSGWRLPTAEELTSLQIPLASGAYTLPSGHPFLDVQNHFYWTATSHPNNALGFAYGVNPTAAPAVSHLGVFQKSEVGHIWCVRGGHGYDGQ